MSILYDVLVASSLVFLQVLSIRLSSRFFSQRSSVYQGVRLGRGRKSQRGAILLIADVNLSCQSFTSSFIESPEGVGSCKVFRKDSGSMSLFGRA